MMKMEQRNDMEFLSQALARVLEPLTGDQLKTATEEAILKHRALIERAEEAYEALEAVSDGEEEKDALLKAYDDALLENRAQIAVVAALTDKLGYIPEVPPQSAEPRA